MDIRITLSGTSPLLCHNVQLSDPDNAFAKEIKAITAKRQKTEDDRRAIEKLEWYGGLYTAPDIQGPAYPTGNVRRCFIKAGTITKNGTGISRALSFKALNVPLKFAGPRDIDELWASGAYANRAAVRVSSARTMRVRPQFADWSLTADAFLLSDVLDFEVLKRVIEQAGLAEGLGDNRVNGYGRFTSELVEL